MGDSTITYSDGLMFSMKMLGDLESEVDEFLAGYCRAIGYLLSELHDAITNIEAAAAAEEETN